MPDQASILLPFDQERHPSLLVVFEADADGHGYHGTAKVWLRDDLHICREEPHAPKDSRTRRLHPALRFRAPLLGWAIPGPAVALRAAFRPMRRPSKPAPATILIPATERFARLAHGGKTYQNMG